MQKIKIKIDNNFLEVSSKLSRGEKISEKEMNLINCVSIIGLAKIRFSSGKKLKYEIPNCVPIADLISSGIDKYTFYKLILKIVDVIYIVKNSQLNINNLCLDLNYIFFDNNSDEIYFLYSPVMNNRNFVNINKFLYNFVLLTNPLFDDELKKDFLDFLNENARFDVADYLNFIQKMYPGLIEQIGALNIKQSISNVSGNQDDTVILNNYNHISEMSEDTVLLSNDGIEISSQHENYSDIALTQPLNNCEDTVILNNACILPVNAYLIMQRDGRRIDISSNEFNIGKDEYCCDLVIDNSSISRKHLTITFDGNNYYATDNNSTNGTSLNGKPLKPGIAEKMENYDRLLLANEIIDFQIMEENDLI